MTSEPRNSHENEPALGAQEREFAPDAIHALRTAQVNTMTLSSMADNKASILMGATFLVFSVAVSRLVAGHLPLSLGVIAVFSFLSTLCAVMALVPSVGPPPKDAPVNRLFFGHFAHLDENQWVEDLLEDLETEEAIFRLMAHDVYQNGRVLERRKYRYLSYAYRLFILGLVVTSATFLIEWSLS